MTEQVTPQAPAAPVAPAPAAAPQPTPVAPEATAPEPAPAPPTPPPAPAEPVQEQIGVEPAQDTTPTVSYQSTGDAGLDIALDFIGKLGLGPENEAVKAAMDGNFERLEGVLSAMGDEAAGYDKYLALGKAAYERQSEEASKVMVEVTAACHEAAGGEEAWSELKQWAGANADPAEKDAINEMLNAGPVQARAAVALLKSAHSQATGTTVQPAEAVSQTSGAAGTTNSGALSPQQYHEAVMQLRQTMGTRMEGSQEYKALQARRLAYRG